MDQADPVTMRRVASLLLLAAAIAVPAPARAGDVPKPLRTLVYKVTLSVEMARHTGRSGLSSVAPQRARGMAAGGAGAVIPHGRIAGNEATTGAEVSAEGAITVDVVAATEDGGLVADLAETAPGRTRAKVRFAVTSDGSVGYDPKAADDVSEEEIALVRWLARGFYVGHSRDVGATWTIDQSGNGQESAEHYRVLAAGDRRVTLDYAFEQKSGGADSFVSSRSGSLVYDTAFVVPVRAAYEGQTRRQLQAAYDETWTSVVLTLAADSFEKRP